MWAIRKLEAGPGLVLDETPVPVPGDDDVLIRVEAASLCGTDLHIFRWDDWAANRVQPPLTLGHEFAGTVAEVGRNVRHVAQGDIAVELEALPLSEVGTAWERQRKAEGRGKLVLVP